MSEIKLKPCPFCGGEAFASYINGDFAVSCVDCGCGTEYGPSKEEAVAAWNRRTINEGHGDCVKCEDDPDFSCPWCGEPCGCNNRALAELARKVAKE